MMKTNRLHLYRDGRQPAIVMPDVPAGAPRV